ncbi:hypothetical protein CLOACE_16320 [Clostridium acetireducens DSM 10703]|jgi:hypothetical protein|uniref:Uncharacterized protein n=1 Tax=Clostridium acetireducens DSM 10703 TaxID=1121290 RepID=A0A1E8EYE7_9CLOT|nr:hypothetical protein [Clostridium acetireducens]OFI05549.1 hypothetical protein CLOACE_16320 [Clostridium acetireducens DSM 10703]
MIDLESLDSCEIAVLATTIALGMAKDKTPDELNVLGNFVVAVGGILLTIAALEQSQSEKN